jgi:hypothetical protein
VLLMAQTKSDDYNHAQQWLECRGGTADPSSASTGYELGRPWAFRRAVLKAASLLPSNRSCWRKASLAVFVSSTRNAEEHQQPPVATEIMASDPGIAVLAALVFVALGGWIVSRLSPAKRDPPKPADITTLSPRAESMVQELGRAATPRWVAGDQRRKRQQTFEVKEADGPVIVFAKLSSPLWVTEPEKVPRTSGVVSISQRSKSLVTPRPAA